MEYKVFLDHQYFDYEHSPVVEVDLPIIPRIGEYIDPWQFLSKDDEELILKKIDGSAYMEHTYVRAIRHDFEEIQRIYLILDNTTLKGRTHKIG